jgi:hypothetical protein
MRLSWRYALVVAAFTAGSLLAVACKEEQIAPEATPNVEAIRWAR